MTGTPEQGGPPPATGTVFGDRLATATAFADLLRTAGVERGLIGPREADRIWERHLLNCAVVAPAFPTGAEVLDVGSGAGLPGIVLAIARPDLSVVLLEPMLRRTRFLNEAVARLELTDRVRVLRGRAEGLGNHRYHAVTARAVAPLDQLAGWCLPLVRPGGRLVAMKGDRAEAELAQAEPALRRLGAAAWHVEEFGVGLVAVPARAVIVDKASPTGAPH